MADISSYERTDDVEKSALSARELRVGSTDDESTTAEPVSRWQGLLLKAARLGRVEVGGIAPIPVEERTVRKTVNVFTLWWCMNANILP